MFNLITRRSGAKDLVIGVEGDDEFATHRPSHDCLVVLLGHPGDQHVTVAISHEHKENRPQEQCNQAVHISAR